MSLIILSYVRRRKTQLPVTWRLIVTEKLATQRRLSTVVTLSKESIKSLAYSNGTNVADRPMWDLLTPVEYR